MKPCSLHQVLPIAFLSLLAPDTAQLTISSEKPRVPVSKSLYGVFFEEINHAGDGGLLAEMLRNRGFESGTTDGWIGDAKLVDDPLNAAHPRTLLVGGEVRNDGFWGMSLRRGVPYRLVLYAKGEGPLTLRLDADGQPGSDTKTCPVDSKWQRYETVLGVAKDTVRGSLVLNANGKPVNLGWASLMPERNWNGTTLRPDLAQKVADIKPGFVRFPGGCFTEANDLKNRFKWSDSVGPAQQRTGIPRSFWGYPITYGLGFHEYLLWCEKMGAEALFVANCGMSHSEVVPMDKMGSVVQEALDAIEYANGPATSKWGAERARNGHPKPFNLRYVEIGNENDYNWSFGGMNGYAERYKLVYDAIKKAHPKVLTISDGPVPHPIEVIDEHYYSSPGWFWSNKDRYDRASRRGPAIYVGEYAVTQDCGRGNLKAALAEAAFMTGMERNSDIVKMASYAPLFENVNSRQWNPNAILFDSSRSYGTPSYWVQRLFGRNRPDEVVASDLRYSVAPKPIRGGIGLQTWETSSEFKEIRLEVGGKTVYSSEGTKLDEWNRMRGQWSVENGVIRQGEMGQDRQLRLKGVQIDADRFVLSLKARKLSGDEGFIVMFGTSQGDSMQWNLGGWGNTQHAFQNGSDIVGAAVPGRIETDRWYDVRIEGEGSRVRGYLDGKLIQEVTKPTPPDLASVVGIDRSRREMVVKLVNGANEVRNVAIDFGRLQPAERGTVTVLTSGSLEDENSLANPDKVAPRDRAVVGIGRGFIYQAPARSLSILRVKLQP